MADFLLSWLLVPVLLSVLSLGCGLLVGTIAERTGAPRGEPFPGLLVLPVGFAAVVVLASGLTNWKLTAPLAGVAPVAVALVGLAVGRHRLGGWWAARRPAVWPALAALVPGAAIAAPVLLTGRAGMSGYTKITDLAHQVAFIEYLRTDGRAPMVRTGSSFDEVIGKLVAGYPAGTQSVVASMGDLARVDVAWAYQPVLAFAAAMLGLALYAVLGRAVHRPWLRAAAAGVAAQPTILYAYALAAGIKELSGAAAIALVAAVFAERRPMSWSTVVPGAVAMAAAFAVFSVTILPWIGLLFLVFAAFELLAERGRVRTAIRWAGVWALAAVLVAPAVEQGYNLFRATGTSGPEGLGNLAAPLPAWAAVGPWITPDHRFPLASYGHPGLTHAAIAIALTLAAIGFATAVLRRDRALVALGVGGALALAYVVRNSGTWVELKAFCMTAPLTLTLAFAGAAWLAGRVRMRALLAGAGLGAGAVVALGVLYGNALQYHATPLLPYERMSELRRIDDRFAGQGPALLPDFDEFAEYEMREARGSGLVDPWRGRMVGNATAKPGVVSVRDVDEFDLAFLQSFRLIVRRRDPAASRPPSNWRLADTTAHYEVWRRTGDPRTVALHVPLDNRTTRRPAQVCRQVQSAARRAGPGARVTYAVPPRDVTAVVGAPTGVPAAWVRRGDDLFAGSPGRLQQGFRIRRGGTYRAYLRASVGRRVTVSVDGRPIGALRWRESYPGHFEPLMTLRLGAGDHTLTIVRGGGNLLPGTGNDASGTTTTIGPAVFEPVAEREVMRSVAPAAFAPLCASGPALDWVEVVRPAAR